MKRKDKTKSSSDLPTADLLLKNEIKTQRKALLGTLALSAAIPAAIMLFVYICIGVWPFGSNSVLVLDLNGQYVYFFEELHNIIYEGKSLFYSWERSLGGEFMGMYGYYLASPLSWLVALLPSSWIVESLLLLILGKVALTGGSMAYFLSQKKPQPRLHIVIFSSLYALCAYSVNYLHNTMWMDALFLLPLVTLGARKLISERKFTLYTITLALTVISNYYIGYMICLYLIAYFIYYHISYKGSIEYNPMCEKAHFLRSLLRFGTFSLIAVAISAAVLFPAVYSLLFGKTTFTDPEISFKTKFDIIDFLFKLFPGATDTVRREGLPYVYCGTLCLFAFPCFICAKKIAPRRKIGACLILFFFFSVMSISAFDLFFHGMQEPNWLNYRYSFIFSFLLITFAYEGFEYISEFKSKFLFGVGAFLSLILILIQQKHYSDNYEYSSTFWYDYDITVVYLGLIFLGLCLAAICLYKNSKNTQRTAILLCACVLSEALLSAGMHHATLAMDVGYASRMSYTSFIDSVSEVSDKISSQDKSFYRMDKTFYRQSADDAALGMRGLSSTTSTMNKYTLTFLHRLGYNADSYWSCFSGSNPAGDSLLGVKYIIDNDDSSSAFYKKLFEHSGTIYYTDEEDIFDTPHELKLSAYENEHALPIAFAVRAEAFDVDFSSYIMPFDLYNDLIGAMIGSDTQIYEKAEMSSPELNDVSSGRSDGHRSYKKTGDEPSVTYTLRAEKSGEYFMYLPTDHPRDCELFLNGENIGTIMANDTDSIVHLGYFEGGSKNEIKIAFAADTEKIYIKDAETYFYRFISEAYEEAFDALSRDPLIIDDDFREDKLTGRITVSADNSLLYTTIPYDRGWEIRIDGEKVDALTYEKTTKNKETLKEESQTLPCADALIAVPISAGTHSVSFVYRSKAIVYGALTSVIGIALFAAIWLCSFLIRRKKIKKHGDYKSAIAESAMIARQIDAQSAEHSDKTRTEKEEEEEEEEE